MFQGLRTLIYRVKTKDLAEAKAWYTKLLGKPPYFDQPFYVGFNVKGFELGLTPTEEKLLVGNAVHTYMGVPNIKEAFEHCLKLGAKIDSEIRDVGDNIKVATVLDPFGNIFGLIENPNFLAE